jgi:hypothetical protein
MYKTPIVGNPKYARKYVKNVFSNHDCGSTLMDQYHSGSNEIALAHPFFNTLHGKKIWNLSNLMLGSSVILFEDEYGMVMVNATIKLPKKFDKFLKVMERMKKYSNTTSNKQ